MSMQFIKSKVQNSDRGYLVYGIDSDAEGVFEDGRRWKGLVVCRIENCEFDVYHALDKMFKGAPVLVDYYNKKCDLRIKDNYVAMAKCSVEDGFDVEKGKELARNRVLKKYRAEKSRALANFNNKTLKAMLKVTKELDFLNDKISED